jgi:hypothetical protein
MASDDWILFYTLNYTNVEIVFSPLTNWCHVEYQLTSDLHEKQTLKTVLWRFWKMTTTVLRKAREELEEYTLGKADEVLSGF